jgi:uncharacterized OB-fold protein
MISGQLLTRLAKKFRDLIGRDGVVYALSSVTATPKSYRDPYDVCIVRFDNGEFGSYQVAKGDLLEIGDQVRIVLRFGFQSERGLRFYLPKVVKNNELRS